MKGMDEKIRVLFFLLPSLNNPLHIPAAKREVEKKAFAVPFVNEASLKKFSRPYASSRLPLGRDVIIKSRIVADLINRAAVKLIRNELMRAI